LPRFRVAETGGVVSARPAAHYHEQLVWFRGEPVHSCPRSVRDPECGLIPRKWIAPESRRRDARLASHCDASGERGDCRQL